MKFANLRIISDIATILSKASKKNIRKITTLEDVTKSKIFKEHGLEEVQQFFDKNRKNISSLPEDERKYMVKLFNLAKETSGTNTKESKLIQDALKSGKNKTQIGLELREQTIKRQIKQAKDAKKALDKAFKEKLNKVFVSKHGLEFKAIDRFQGAPFDETVLPRSTVDKWIGHVKDEYLDLADDLIDRGKLVKEKNTWYGKFEKDGKEILKKVNPVDYVMAQSKAFKTAGLSYSGTSYYSGMTFDKYQKFVKNGGTEAPDGIWMSSTPSIGTYYATYTSAGEKSSIPGKQVRLVGPKIKDSVVHIGGSGSTSINFEDGRDVMTLTKERPYSFHVFDRYIDPLVPSAGKIKTIVYPRGTQMKDFQFNSGDFDMTNLSPYAKKGGIINYLEYCE